MITAGVVCLQNILMPMPSIQLTATKLVSNGCFLLDDGEELLMWIGRGAPPMMLNALFGAEVSSLDGLDAAQVRFLFCYNAPRLALRYRRSPFILASHTPLTLTHAYLPASSPPLSTDVARATYAGGGCKAASL